MLLLVTVLVAAVHIANGVSTGAPSQACGTLTPQHSTNQPQTTPSPHIVDLSDFNVTMNDVTGGQMIYYYPDTMYQSEPLSCIHGRQKGWGYGAEALINFKGAP